jgi:hypothetical protein
MALVLLSAVEGSVLVWLQYKRQQAAALREQELNELRPAYHRLASADAHEKLSVEKLRASNRIMLDTLDRFLERRGVRKDGTED